MCQFYFRSPRNSMYPISNRNPFKVTFNCLFRQCSLIVSSPRQWYVFRLFPDVPSAVVWTGLCQGNRRTVSQPLRIPDRPVRVSAIQWERFRRPVSIYRPVCLAYVLPLEGSNGFIFIIPILVKQHIEKILKAFGTDNLSYCCDRQYANSFQ